MDKNYEFSDALKTHIKERISDKNLADLLTQYQKFTMGNFYYRTMNINNLIEYARFYVNRDRIETLQKSTKNEILENSEVFSDYMLLYYRMRSIKNILDEFLENNKSFKIKAYEIFEYDVVEASRSDILDVIVDNSTLHVIQTINTNQELEFDHAIKKIFYLNPSSLKEGIKHIDLIFTLKNTNLVRKFVATIFSREVDIFSVKIKTNGIILDEDSYEFSIDTFKDVFIINFNEPVAVSEIILSVALSVGERSGFTTVYFCGIGECYVTNEADYSSSANVEYMFTSTENTPRVVCGENDFIINGKKDEELLFLPNINNDGIEYINGQIILSSSDTHYIELFPKLDSGVIRLSNDFGQFLEVQQSDLVYDRILIISKEIINELALAVGDIMNIQYAPKKDTFGGLFPRTDIVDNTIFVSDDDKITIFVHKFERDTNNGIVYIGKEEVINLSSANYYKNLLIEDRPDGSKLSFLRINITDVDYIEYAVLKLIEIEDMYWYVSEEFIISMASNNSIKISLSSIPVASTIKPIIRLGKYMIICNYDDNITNPELQMNEILVHAIPNNINDIEVFYQPARISQSTNIISNLANTPTSNMAMEVKDGVITIPLAEIIFDFTIYEKWKYEKGTYTHNTMSSIKYTPFKCYDRSTGSELLINSIIADAKIVSIELSEKYSGDCLVSYFGNNMNVNLTVTPLKNQLTKNFGMIIE